MNVLMLSDVYFPRVNGVSTSIRTLALGLVRLGHRVTLVAPDYEGAGDEAAFELIRLPSRRIFFDPEDRLIRATALDHAERRLLVGAFDVIHVHTPFQAHRLGVRLRRATGAPLIETYHTHFESYVAHYLPWAPAAWLRFAARALTRRLCRAADHLVAPSVQMVEVLRGYGIDTPTTVIPTGVDPAEFTGGSGARFRSRHGIARHRPVIVTISRLAQEKNIAFLLEVARRLIGWFPEMLFVVAGEGPDAQRLRRIADELGLGGHVRFFGNLERKAELLDCYRAGDVFVFASPTETQGLVLIEAMSLGVPIVSTAVLGTASVLANARSARVSPEEPVAFARAVAELLDNPGLREVLSALGPEDARRWHAPPLVERMAEIYQRLAGERAPSRRGGLDELSAQ